MVFGSQPALESVTYSNTPYFMERGPHGIAQPITERIRPHSRPIVSYYFPKDVGAQHYGERHPMKPHRLTLTNALVLGYGLDKQIHNIYDVRRATREELEVYHDSDYIEFLSKVTPQNQLDMRDMLDKYNCGEDCPIFSDMYDFCRMSSGGSLAAARKLCAGTTDIAINWSGGLHHAKRGEASGFCYTNDIVLGILELLRYHPRVLYIDIDIHHGDGVEFAFYNSNRVMTVSFHKYTGDFFPGTGKLDDNGVGLGRHFCLNVPLLDGINDEMYLTIFKAVIGDTINAFKPAAIVLQCGADSLGCDRLGAFNLSIAAHGECVNFVRSYSIPLLIVGGGGYTIKNVSRCWTYETAVLVGADIPNELPATVYDSFFADSHWKLHPPLTGKVDNQNTAASLQRITISIKEKLRYLQGAPSVAMQEIPPNLEGLLDDEDRTHEEKMEEKSTALAGEDRRDRHNAPNEFYDGEKDVVDVTIPPPTSKAPTSTSRRARGGRRGGRGRGRGRGGRGAAASARDPDEDVGGTSSSDEAPERPPPSKRARGGRGRGGRGRGGRVKSAQVVEGDESDLAVAASASAPGGEKMAVDQDDD